MADENDWLGVEQARIAKRRASLRVEPPKLETGGAQEGAWGLALSGGGIRSATFALGVLQALAKAELKGANGKPASWLRCFDYLSTVSGGGYIGAFFVSLFLPRRLEPPPDGAPWWQPAMRTLARALPAGMRGKLGLARQERTGAAGGEGAGRRLPRGGGSCLPGAAGRPAGAGAQRRALRLAPAAARLAARERALPDAHRRGGLCLRRGARDPQLVFAPLRDRHRAAAAVRAGGLPQVLARGVPARAARAAGAARRAGTVRFLRPARLGDPRPEHLVAVVEPALGAAARGGGAVAGAERDRVLAHLGARRRGRAAGPGAAHLHAPGGDGPRARAVARARAVRARHVLDLAQRRGAGAAEDRLVAARGARAARPAVSRRGGAGLAQRRGPARAADARARRGHEDAARARRARAARHAEPDVLFLAQPRRRGDLGRALIERADRRAGVAGAEARDPPGRQRQAAAAGLAAARFHGGRRRGAAAARGRDRVGDAGAVAAVGRQRLAGGQRRRARRRSTRAAWCWCCSRWCRP